MIRRCIGSGDLDLKSRRCVLQHQIPLNCKDLNIEELIGNRDQNLGIPDRDEKPLIGTVGIIDEDEQALCLRERRSVLQL